VDGLPPPTREKVQAEGAVGARAGCEGALMSMKVIFLDIDGVLNCDRTPNPRKFPYVVDRRLLARLKKLLNRTRAKVVLSSSWRLDPVGLLAAKYWGVPFIDTLPDLPKKTRRDEVLSWLAAHPKVARFAIIDDEDDGLDDLPLFQPSSKTGITMEIVKGVDRYLSGSSDKTMRATLLVRAGQNIHSLFKRDKS
jgi:Swiss Army Knife RNA repair-like protein